MLGLYVPAGQGSKVMLTVAAPMALQKPPVGHALHVVELRSALYSPTSQLVHSGAPSPLYCPGMQGKQRMLPRLGEYEPAGQTWQAVRVWFWKEPSEQDEHSSLPRERSKP